MILVDTLIKIENLELWASRHPKGQRVTDLIEYAKEILEQTRLLLAA